MAEPRVPGGPPEVSPPLRGYQVGSHGAVVDENGARFDGSGDYITVSSFDYYSDASFSISYWMTKEGCTSGVYEYVYSHQQARDLDLLDPANSNVNMYLACESTGGGWSTSAGSVVRFLLQDSSGSANYARFDYPLHDAGDFDAITNRWVHIVLSVDGSSSSRRSVQSTLDALPIHGWESKCHGCSIVRKFDPSLTSCPVVDCLNTTVAELGYKVLKEQCTAADTSLAFE